MHAQHASRPLIAITPDIAEPTPGKVRAQCSLNYPRAVAAAGGLPVFLAPAASLIPEQLRAFDGFILTGGDDPRTEPFGEATHPKATPMHELRQAYEVALIRALLDRPEIPVLGICLGMQLLALVAGGKLDQHMADNRSDAGRHTDDHTHAIVPVGDFALGQGEAVSHHNQAVTDPGRLAVAARSDDGVIEAIHDPRAAFCIGVQWHPERTPDPRLGRGVFDRFVQACVLARARRGSPERKLG